MARIVFAWELGGSIGHAVASARLGAALAARGHEVAFIFRDLTPLRFLPEAQAFPAFQAPRIREEGRATSPSGYAEILQGYGYLDSRSLIGLVGAWRSLLTDWKADLVVADFSPTALLAARTLGLRRVTYGNGFFTPPRLAPLPPFRIGPEVDIARLAENEAQVLAVVNQALAHFSAKPLAQLSGQFETDEDFLCTFAELDHYGTRPVSHYWGPRMSTDAGASVHWPSGGGKKVLVYVQAQFEGLDELIGALRMRPHSVVAFIPRLDESRRRALEGPRRKISPSMARLDTLLAECDLLVCHGGEIAPGALMHGVPTLMLPQHYEQFLMSLRMQQLGAGLAPGAPPAPGEITALLDRLLAEPAHKTNAASYAKRHPQFSPREQRRRVIQRIEDILATNRTTPQGSP
ncbi:glycosyltransferase [Usitatibacter palustris]|uniref:Erythromycin biosynthesis protein CIII-like C-terminal domain-containing protein n=1 Tax=Usitatibacter palustris TaxID=2732487 RepID=A0A6M4HD89_9PROT|nr:nucleotide disphospho-sugar-binding domain-containing protein [Usitatibacter palustris]QJR15957.1 hypothetical protein DSM104440_02785 [Usitatibacter palustris]